MLSYKTQLAGALPHILLNLKWVVTFCTLVVALGATRTDASPVVVGSVNPVTNRVTIFEDLMVKTFADGGSIQHFYGGYGTESRAYFLVRAGKMATGGCRTEVFRLVRIADNRLAIADPSNVSLPWNPQIVSKIFATFDCTSPDCLFCETDNQNDPLGGDPDSGCACTQTGSFAGKCNTTRPGMSSYGARQLTTASL